MKNIYLFLLFLILLGCQSNAPIIVKSNYINCPSILFAKNHNIFVDSIDKDISIDNISYKAEINNAVFDEKCKINDNNLFSNKISILFIVSPLIRNKANIRLPFFIALFDQGKNLKDLQYFLIDDSFKKDSNTNFFTETEITTSLEINFESIADSDTFLIGFMLDKKRLEILNY